MFGVRDAHGFRPLVLGRTEGGWVLASETAALDIVGAHFVRDVEPGELVAIDATGVRSIRFAEPTPKLCLFEFVYIARPDTQLYGQSVHGARQRMGEELARQAPCADADMVMPVPESGVPAAQGYARGVGHPLRRRLREEPLRRPHVHPADPEAARHRRAPQAQPAPRQHQGQAARRRRRLDRARHHHPPDHRVVARGRRDRGALPGVVAAVPLAVLLRPRHRQAFRSARGRHVGRRDQRLPRCRLARVPRSRSARRGHRLAAARRSAPRASPATTRCRCPSTTPSSCSSPSRPRSSRSTRSGARDLTAMSPPDDERLTYADAGVDIAAGEKAVELIKAHVRSTFRPEVDRRRRRLRRPVRARLEALPRSAARVVDRRRRHEVARSPASPNRRDTIGIDCVAMSVDDIAAQGAEPLFFLDYISVGTLVPDEIDELVAGVAEGCRQARCALLGGEMSEHPGRDGAGRVRPRRVRGRRRRAGARAAARRARRRSHRRHREPGPAVQRLLARARRAARPRGTRPRRAGVAGRAPLARRRVARAERDLRARDAEARRRSVGARVRARHRRRHPRQPRACAPRPLRRAS